MENRQRMEIHLFIPYFLITLGIFYLSTMRVSSGESGWLEFLPFAKHPHFDKIVHLAMYFIHASIGFLSFPQRKISYAASFSLAICTELIQFFLPYRSFELLDIISNFLGILFSGFLFTKISKIRLHL